MGFALCIKVPILEYLHILSYITQVTLCMIIPSLTPFFKSLYDQLDEENLNSTDQEYFSPFSSLSSQIYSHSIASLTKEQLPTMEYGCYIDKLGGFKGEFGDSPLCVVCLNSIGESDEIRDLRCCCHLFHRECIDEWLDQGQATCPLCRSKL